MTLIAPLSHQAFAFDTEFDGSGGVVRGTAWQPAKKSYMPAEVDALVAQARLEAREATLAEVESLQAMAVVTVAQSLTAAMPSLNHIAQTHREQSAELALAAGRVIALAALDRFPAGPLQAALEALGQEIDASPRLVIRAPDLNQAVRDKLQAVATDAGFSGLIAFREDAGLPLAAFQLEWSDGRADFDPAEAAARMHEALTAALAAEAGHAENLTQGSAL